MKLVFLASTFILHSLIDASPMRRTGRTSGSEKTSPGNPCFQQPSSAVCVAYVADKRGILPAQARTLIAQAVSLFTNETMPSEAVAVACLASRGTLLPGPNEDCVACGSACNAECRLDVCELYCTSLERDTKTSAMNFGAVTRPTARQTETEYSCFAKATANNSIFISLIAWKVVAFAALIIFVAFIAVCVFCMVPSDTWEYLCSQSRWRARMVWLMWLNVTMIALFNLSIKIKKQILKRN